MANLHPKYFKSHIYKYGPQISNNANSIEIFLDYNCPYSSKIFKKIEGELIPLIKKNKLEEKYNLIFVNVVQPWHGFQSSILHDVSFAVGKVEPELFWKFSRILFDNIEKFYDSEVFDLTRRQVTEKVIKLAADNLKIDEEKLWDYLNIKRNEDKSPSNFGNLVSKDNKYFTKYQRTLGVHVTPSVLVNGIYQPNIESSTPADEILKILENQTA